MLNERGHQVTGYDIGFKFPEQEFDGIIHLAAISRVSDAERRPLRAVEANVMLTARILELHSEWFILASTAEEPKNVYGLTKRFAEDYAKLRHGNLLILRFENIYGPGDNPRRLMPRLAMGEKLALRHDLFPFAHVHVDTAVDRIMLATEEFYTGTERICTGTAKNKEELLRVAASY